MRIIKRLLFMPAFMLIALPFVAVFVFKGIDKANEWMDKAFGLIENWQN